MRMISKGLRGVADFCQFVLDVVCGDCFVVVFVAHVEFYAGAEEPVEGKLVDGLGWFTLDLTVVVVGGVDVCGSVCAEFVDGFDCPAFLIAQEVCGYAEHVLDGFGACFVVFVGDLYLVYGGCGAILNGAGEVDYLHRWVSLEFWAD